MICQLVLEFLYLTRQLLFSYAYLHSLYQRTPMYIAAKEGYYHTVRYLVEKGADANIADDAGVSMWKNQLI